MNLTTFLKPSGSFTIRNNSHKEHPTRTQSYSQNSYGRNPQSYDIPMTPVTAAMPLPIRDLALSAINDMRGMQDKIKAIAILEEAAGVTLESCRWSTDIKRLHEEAKLKGREDPKHLQAANLLEAAICSLLDIPHRLKPGTMGNTINS